VAASNEYNDPGRDSNKPPSARPSVCLPLSRCCDSDRRLPPAVAAARTGVNLFRQASVAATTAGGRRRSLSQLRLTLQIILSISRGGVTEQLSDHLCNYDRQPVTVLAVDILSHCTNSLTLQNRQTQVKFLCTVTPDDQIQRSILPPDNKRRLGSTTLTAVCICVYAIWQNANTF